ncbi:restriction endonuclease subunit S [Aliivibrio fischeri]|uniref:restriction endonuclease subunit S n=1 Tax=Aliivibrio fischeri TaxID=668 RepID=UPI0012DAC19D|nr:restriction endonuclease subunit S [Aliivibrio fischeri]MUJ23807.1 restriction endonuclease subunit S [Aliivibrio fischeri]
MSVERLITDNIDVWTSTVKTKSASGRGSSKKIELYGIKKLRELILELAVRGKLVPQDPTDESASVLLDNIKEEQAKFVVEKKIKKPKELSPICDFDKPFLLPYGWEWELLGNICHIERGGSPRPIKSFLTDESDGLNWIKIGDTDIGGKYITSTAEKIRPEGLSKTRQVYPGDFLLTNSMSFGRPYISKIEGCIHDGWLRLSPPSSLDKDYLYSLLSSPFIVRSFKKSAAGAVVMNLNADKVRETIVAIPPTAEQHRIVAKVEELMLLCDQLEQQTETSIEAHQTLVEVLLNTLTSSADAQELMQNWQRISKHFDALFTTEKSIDTLKQTILQLAVMGKLVPQDPNDEPAVKLLERIAEEKAQLIKDKKIKKHPSVEPIGDVGKIPKNWKEIVVQDFADIRLGSTPSRHESKYWNGDIPWVSSGEVANGVIVDTTEKITQAGFDNSSTSIIPKRSLLMAIIGQGKTRGQTALLGIDACTNQNVAAFVFNEKCIIPEYVWLWAQSKYESHRQDGHGGAQPALNGRKVRSFAFPLPPTMEQKRIVEKVNELNLVCDQLKTHLKESQTTQLHLTDAIIDKAL